MQRHYSQAALIFFSLTAASASWALEAVRIVATGETHGMLYPCDCPQSPGGGVATRATVLAQERKQGPLVLVDAGGFAAGGIYDEYSEGRARDSVRTEAMIRALGMIGYDAVAIGDDELQYDPRWLTERCERWNVPLVCANCKLNSGEPMAVPFIVVERGGIRFGITAVCTVERLFSLHSSVHIEPPVSALRRIWPALASGTDVQIILAHVGEEESIALNDSFPQCNVIVNGHRKSSTAAVERRNGRHIMQFGYQGKAMSSLSVHRTPKGLLFTPNGWIEIGQWISPDSAVENAIRIIERGSEAEAQVVTFDLYIMSRCPYGLAAAAELASLDLANAVWNIWFIGNVENNDVLTSLQGNEEILDEMRWLAVCALYPDRWRSFVVERGKNVAATTSSLTQKLGMDTAVIDAWVATRGHAELAMHYRRSSRLRISLSPTLLVNGDATTGPITRWRLIQHWCSRKRQQGEWCDSLPVCFDNHDCRRPGKLGACVTDSTGKAECVFRDDAAFVFCVLRPDSSTTHPEDRIIRSTLELFPAAIIDTVNAGSPRGQKLIEKYQPHALPFFLFDTAVQYTANFSHLREALVRIGDTFTFKNGTIKPSYFFQRPLQHGSVLTLIDPAFKDAGKAIGTVLEAIDRGQRLSVLPSFGFDSTAGVEATYRQEESLRWLILSSFFPRQYVAYLRWFASHAGSSYWIDGLKTARVSLKRFERHRARAETISRQHRRLVEELGIDHPVALLIDNREVVAVRNHQELIKFFGHQKWGSQLADSPRLEP